ncbi:uncharacterized protein LOC144101612 [Amblyomma americanum]
MAERHPPLFNHHSTAIVPALSLPAPKAVDTEIPKFTPLPDRPPTTLNSTCHRHQLYQIKELWHCDRNAHTPAPLLLLRNDPEQKTCGCIRASGRQPRSNNFKRAASARRTKAAALRMLSRASVSSTNCGWCCLVLCGRGHSWRHPECNWS